MSRVHRKRCPIRLQTEQTAPTGYRHPTLRQLSLRHPKPSILDAQKTIYRLNKQRQSKPVICLLSDIIAVQTYDTNTLTIHNGRRTNGHYKHQHTNHRP
jgi:hypothetical protein